MRRVLWLLALIWHVAAGAAEPDGVLILSATVKDERIGGAQVLLQKNGIKTFVNVTDGAGWGSLAGSEISPDDPTALLIVRKDGYSTLVSRCPCNRVTYALSPVMEELDAIRIVLTWSSEPADLDAHLTFGDSWVYHRQKIGVAAQLDVDDRDGGGPETVTITDKQYGETYVYAVYDFTNNFATDTPALARSRARVTVYVGSTLVRTYTVDPSQRGNVWAVFAITAAGDFLDLDQYSSEHSGELGPAFLKLMASQRGTAGTRPYLRVTEEALADARALNEEGEAAYRAKLYDDAISLFQAAIERNPDYGQAYSNLGLVFDKAGRAAEAIWANRKAIALASGASAKRVRANSYYNIGRMYERSRLASVALRYYRLAHEQRPSRSYAEAIARTERATGSD